MKRSVGSDLACGVDVVEVAKLRKAIVRTGKPFLKRVFTPLEVDYAQSRPRTKFLHLAGRFAAKEAVIKALSQMDARAVVPMNRIELYNDNQGRPHIRLLTAAGKVSRSKMYQSITIHISIAHVESVAVANAIVVRS